MINNGYIQASEYGGTTSNQNGDPVVIAETWGDLIICQIETVKHDNKGIYLDGKYTQATYKILIEMQEFQAKRIKITDSRGNSLGEFNVQDIQFLDMVQRVKITV